MSTALDWRRMAQDSEAEESLRRRRARPLAPPPSALAHVMRKALEPVLREAGPAATTLAARWLEIVGPKLAAVSEPLKVTAGKNGASLSIRAHAAAAPLLQHASKQILERVSLAGGKPVTAIRIVQTAADAKATVVAKPAPSISFAQRQELVSALERVENGAVRAALAKLGEAVLVSRGR